MKCPKCEELGLMSTVRVGASITTCAAASSWYDEEGNYHYYDPNSTTTNYSCSQGHAWSVTRKHMEDK